MEEAADMQVGKFFTFSVNAENENEAKGKISKICEDVLSNPILENYRVERIKTL
jgi:phosphoribosylformylglycinamidine (FGAM) synthase PurS component